MYYSDELNEFLFFSYFGIKKECVSNEEILIKQLVNRAYRDAACHIHSYNTKEECSNTIFSNILELRKWNQTENTDKSFDEWHSEVCKSLKNIEIGTTYGMVQKWVNMSLKYLLLIGDEKVEKIKEKLHVPIDRYILIASASEGRKLKHKNPFVLNIDLPRKRVGKDNPNKGAFSDEKTISWSQWEEEEYIEFQNQLREIIRSGKFKDKDISCPIEWEIRAWIEQARIECNIQT